MKNKTEENRRNLEMIALTWTISGVVLAACGTFEDFLGLDDSGGGGNALHVQRSPVQGARLYFDLDNDGDIEADDETAQDALFPQGFVTDATGRAHNIPTIFQGLPFKAVLDGAIDADTGAPLSGEMFSIPGADGAHRLASPITDLIANDPNDRDPKTVVADLLNNPNADSDEVAQALEAILNPRSYLGGDANIEALAVYLAETNSPAQDKASEFLVGDDDPDPQNRETLFIANADDMSTTAEIDLEGVAISTDAPAGTYIATIHAVSHGGSSDVEYSIVESDGTTPDPDSVFSVDSQGVISVAGALSAGMNEVYVQVTDGNSMQTVKIDVMVADAPSLDELPAGDEVGTIMENTPSTDALISGITPDDTSITAADFVIREAVPAGLGFLVDRLEIVDGTGNTFNLALKSGQSLDYDAIPGGVLNVHVWAETSSGVRSNALELRIQVEEDPDEVGFSGSFTGIVAEDGNLVAQGTFSVENQPENAEVTVSNQGTYGTLTLADGRWTYTLDDSIARVDGLLTGEVLLDTVKLIVGTTTQNILIRINGANEDVHFVDADENRITRDVADEGIEIGLDATSGVNLGDVVPEIRGLLPSNDDSNVVLADDMGGLFSLDSATGILTFTGTAADIAGLNGSADLVLVLTAPASIGDEEVRLDLRVNVINEDDDGRAEYEVTGDVDVGQTLTVSRVQGSEDPDGVVGAVSFQWFRGDEGTPAFTLLGTGDTYRVTQADINSSDSIGVFVRYMDGSGTTYTHTDNDDTTTIAVFATPVTFTSPAIADRTINLDEDTASGPTPRFNVQATSEDDAGNTIGIASYELLDENRDVVSEYKGFEIDANGVITLTGSLDYEMDETIILRVRATDENSPAETATLRLTVNVGDVNEHAPVFFTNADDPTLTDGTEEISESAGRGTVVARVRAVDADGSAENNTVGYDITNGDPNDVFRIDGNGVITVNAPLDFDTTPSYTLTITATDGESGSTDATQMVTINLSDVNDIVPDVTPPMDATGRVRTTGSDDASGNAAASTGYRITITDADTNNDFTFGVSDPRFDFVRQANSDVWDLVLLAGQAVTEDVGAPDITLTYYVDDGANRVPGGTVTLTVIDTPVGFTNDRTETVMENNRAGADVIQVQASSTHEDGTDSPITSYMFLDENDMPTTKHQGFTIDSTTGQITVDDRLDYDADDATLEFTLRVIATDTPDPNVQGDEAETATQNITISLGDANDNMPTIRLQMLTTISESHTNADGAVFTVTSSDADGSPENSNVIYSIVQGNRGNVFDIDASTGVITVVDGASLDYDSLPIYQLTIGVRDGRDRFGTEDDRVDSTGVLTITLTDVNDIVPDVTPPMDATGRVKTTGNDDATTNPVVSTGYSITITDADTNNDFTFGVSDPRFDFVRQANSDIWELVLLAGQAVTEQSGTTASPNTITITYYVDDGNNRVAGGTVTLTVIDTPVSFAALATRTIPLDENNAANTAVATVTATSVNPDGDPVFIDTFMFLDANDNEVSDYQGFNIATTGTGAGKQASITIPTANTLNHEATDSYTLRVRATDTEDETATLTLIVNVRDVSEDANYAVSGTVAAGNRLSITGTDPDGVLGTISYQWFDDETGENAPGASTGATYTIPNADPATHYAVRITYTDAFDNEEAVVYDSTGRYEFLVRETTFAGNDETASIALGAKYSSNGNVISTGQLLLDFVGEDGNIVASNKHKGFVIDDATNQLSLDLDVYPDGLDYGALTADEQENGIKVIIRVEDPDEVTEDKAFFIKVTNVRELEFEPATDPEVMPGLGFAEFGSPTDGVDMLDGEATAEYIAGGYGDDTITSGGGADHIWGGIGDDTITLSSAKGSAETIYYRFSSGHSGAWISVDGDDTINNFRRGEDKIVLVDTDSSTISLDDFLSNNNRGTNGGQLVVTPRFNSDKIIGADIKFGSKTLQINYAADSQEVVRSGNTYNALAEKYLGAGASNPAGWDGTDLTDNTLLRNYFGGTGNTNLQITDSAFLAGVGADVIIPETHEGAVATASTTSGSSRHFLPYRIIDGDGIGDGDFSINSDGVISVRSSASLDYDDTSIYTLTISFTDGFDDDGDFDSTIDFTDTITIAIRERFNAVYEITKSGNILTAELVSDDSSGTIPGSVTYQWFTTDGTSVSPLGTESDSNTLDTSISGNELPSSDSVYGVTVAYDNNAPFFSEAGHITLLTSVIIAPTDDDADLAGTSAADYIVGGAGDDTITSGGGNDHIWGGPGEDVDGLGDDTITLSEAAGSVETIYYTFFTADSGVWFGINGSDTINNFRRGEDRIVFFDSSSLYDERPAIDLATFLSADNRGTDGGQLVITPQLNNDKIVGTDIKFDSFGNFGSNTLRINYATDSQEEVRSGNTYNARAEKYLGTGTSNPAGWDGTDLTDNTLLQNYFGDGTHDNLQISDGGMNVIWFLPPDIS